jgi:aspartate carbamoyltransferase regulatory subunit
VGDVLEFKKPQKQIKKNDLMCRNGHHKWEVVSENQFDVKQGKLVTAYRCKYCGKKKARAH